MWYCAEFFVHRSSQQRECHIPRRDPEAGFAPDFFRWVELRAGANEGAY